MKNRILVAFDLELTLCLTRSQARRARSAAFKAKLRSALAHSTATEALAEALDVDVDRLALRET